MILNLIKGQYIYKMNFNMEIYAVVKKRLVIYPKLRSIWSFEITNSVCTPVQTCIQVQLCSYKFAPPCKVEQIRIQHNFASRCFYLKHRLQGLDTSGAHLHPSFNLHRVQTVHINEALEARFLHIKWNQQMVDL